MPVPDANLQKILLEQKLLDAKKIENFVKKAKTEGVSLQETLFTHEALPDDVLGKTVAGVLGVPFVKLAEANIVESLLRIVPYAVASHQFVLPFNQQADQLYVAMYDPGNKDLINLLEQKTGFKIVPHFATKKDIKASLKFF